MQRLPGDSSQILLTFDSQAVFLYLDLSKFHAIIY